MANESKIRLLALYKVLYEKTDEDHPLSTVQLIDILCDEFSISAHRTTIAKDVDILKAFGVDIIKIESTQNKYFIASREFETPELKLLIDAVSSSKFITEKKSSELIAKIEKLTSINKAKDLKRNLCTEGRIKPGNEKIYYIVDTINNAINQGKKIAFQYFKYDVKKKRHPKNKGEIYIFSPYSLVWNGDFYYMVGYSDKHENVGNFRVDRIVESPKILKDDAVRMPSDFDLAEYITSNFRMYNAEPETIELICDNDVMDSIVDKFGEGVKTFANDMETFRIVVDVSPTHIFFSWVFGFRGKVRIRKPENVKQRYAQMIQSAFESLS